MQQQSAQFAASVAFIPSVIAKAICSDATDCYAKSLTVMCSKCMTFMLKGLGCLAHLEICDVLLPGMQICKSGLT